MCRVLQAGSRRHPPRHGAGSRQKPLLPAGPECWLCVPGSVGLRGGSATSTTLGHLPSHPPAPALVSHPRAAAVGLWRAAAAWTPAAGHLLLAQPTPEGQDAQGTGGQGAQAPVGFALHLAGEAPGSAPARPAQLPHQRVVLGGLCPSRAAAPLPHARLAGAHSQTHRRHPAPSAPVQEQRWLRRGPVQQRAGGWGRGGLPARGGSRPSPCSSPRARRDGAPRGRLQPHPAMPLGRIKENYSRARRHEPHARPRRQPGHSHSNSAVPQGQPAPVPQASGTDSPRHGCLHRAGPGGPSMPRNPHRARDTKRDVTWEKTAQVP